MCIDTFSPYIVYAFVSDFIFVEMDVKAQGRGTTVLIVVDGYWCVACYFADVTALLEYLDDAPCGMNGWKR